MNSFLNCQRICIRSFSSTSSRNLREIIKKEEGKNVIFEGVKVESPRSKNLIDPKMFKASGSCEKYEKCHPLCQFDKIHEVKHTDVLILEQFVDNKGNIIDRDITKLCERQHYRMNKLIGMAQKAGLLDVKDKYVKSNIQTFYLKYE